MQATLTLLGTEPLVFDLSEAACHDALALSPSERAYVISVGIADALATAAPTGETNPTAEDLAAIGRGIADADAGRTVSGTVVFARLRERYGFPKGDNPMETAIYS